MADCTLRIQLDDDEAQFRGGETVAGRVFVSAVSDTTCNALTVDRFWRTGGKGNEDSGGHESLTLFKGQWSAGQRYEYPFRFTAPASPLSYTGTLVEVEHVIEATADVPWAINADTETTFEVIAGGSGGRHEAPGVSVKPAIPEDFQSAMRGKPGLIGGGVMAIFGLITTPIGIGFLIFPVGLGLVFYALWHTLAQMAVGSAQVHLPSTILHPGESQELAVYVTPTKTLRITRIVAVLRGTERSVKGSGKQRKVHTHKLHERTLMLCELRELAAGQTSVFKATLDAPQTDALSFIASNNRITWELTVRIGIPFWPDWTKKMPLVMAPTSAVSEMKVEVVETIAPKPRRGVEPPRRSTPEPPREAARLSQVPLVVTPPPPPPPTPPVPPPPPVVTEEAIVPEPPPQAVEPKVEVRSELHELLRDIAAADRFSGARQKRLEEVGPRTFTFTIQAQRVEWTLGLNAGPEFRSGRTIVGTLDPSTGSGQGGSGLPIAVRFPQSRNAEVEAIKPGAAVPITARLAEWNGLHDRGEFEVV